MAFGQPAGPPATARQVQELLEALERSGYGDLRTARHRLGLNQRQAGGRFTRDEATALIDRLSGEEGEDAAPDDVSVSPRDSAASKMLQLLAAEQLAIELERRGWTVIPP